MANATPRDTRAGWDFFVQSGGDITLGDLNAKLAQAGYNPVHDRTIRHYHNLLRAGYTRYISINRFDVAHAAEPYESPSAKGRYSYRTVDVGVQVTFAKSSTLFETIGRAIEVGDVGAVLMFEDDIVRQGLEKLRPALGDMVSIRFLEAGTTVAGRITEADLKSIPSRIEVEYSQLTSIAEIAKGESLSTTEARFVLIPDESFENTIDLAGRRLYLFFELIEGFRAIVNSAGAEQVQPVYADPPVLTGLSIASPAVIVIQLADAAKALFPYGVLTSVLVAAGRAIDKRKVWHEGSKEKYEAKQANEKAKRDKEKTKQEEAKTSLATLEVRLKTAEVEVKEAEAELAKQQADLKQEVLNRLHSQLPQTAVSDHTASALIDAEIVTVLEKLADSGISRIQERAPRRTAKESG